MDMNKSSENVRFTVRIDFILLLAAFNRSYVNTTQAGLSNFRNISIRREEGLFKW